VNALPKGIKKSEDAIAETIENNVRRLIIKEPPVDPAYYERMSKLLDALIEQRRKGMVNYKDYLEKIVPADRTRAWRRLRIEPDELSWAQTLAYEAARLAPPNNP
jgi:hypothetical protein